MKNEKYRDSRNRYKRKYYKKTAYSKNHHQRWTIKEINMIMDSDKTDMEISKIIGRSVASIQTMRNRILSESKSCKNCIHLDKKITEEPCIICDHHNLWERNGKTNEDRK